jgi:ubiquinone/menaquinone biosynthesis C-methylase UbiE
MSAPKGYINTEALNNIANVIKLLKTSSYEAMHIESGHNVLDLGCGPATDTISLGALVGPTGQVIGVDYDIAMLDEANQRAEQAQMASWVAHQQADAAALPFSTDYFDASRSERMFQHLPKPKQALSEMIRVTKPGGWVVILDPDWGSLSIDTEETVIERKLARFIADTGIHNGYSGRTLYRLFKQHGLEDVHCRAFSVAVNSNAILRQSIQADRTEQDAIAAGILTTEEVDRWRKAQEQADNEGVFFASVSLFLVAGRKNHIKNSDFVQVFVIH